MADNGSAVKVAEIEHFDELRDENGEVREHWRALDERLSEGFAEVKKLHGLAKSILHEDGASYSVYGDPAGLNRSWPLDIPPLLLPKAEWEVVSQGISARARLLDLVLRDIYGPQRLIRQGVIPARLVFAHPGYTRAWSGADNSFNTSLTLYALDLARDSSGQFYVIGDRAQNPSGSGYALENRVVMGRVLPELFRDSHVLRLAQYFSALRDRLTELAPEGNENPRIVLLTPGSSNETYFEQSFLASYLGISLVEGQDLYVRKGKVWVRSLGRKEPVDVILRRLDDDYCDPLEFRGESLLGVPGLAEVARRGNVVIVNPIGTGVLENTAMYPYMHKVAKFFGEPELSLSQVKTWWCGVPEHLEYVLNNLPKLVIKPVWRGGKIKSVLGRKLDKKALDSLKQQIRANPENWVAQYALALSTVPSLGENQMESCGMVLRGFAVAEENGYRVMAGGLTRVGVDSETDLVSNQRGSRSKDTWVLSNDTEAEISLWIHPQHKLNESAPERLVRGSSADNLFWMGRYAERADIQLNLLRLVGKRLGATGTYNDLQLTASQQWLMRLLTDLSLTYPGFTDPSLFALRSSVEAELKSVTADENRFGSMAFSLFRMIGCAHRIHSQLSSDMRRVIGQIETELEVLKSDPPNILNYQIGGLLVLKDQMLALNCLAGQSMIRGLSWRFLDTGRRIERSIALLRLQLLLLVEPVDEQTERDSLEVLLAMTDNDVNYQQRYAVDLTIDQVLDLLLLEVNNPRSIAYQLNQLSTHMEKLPARDNSSLRTEERFVIEATTKIRLANSIELSRRDEETGRREELSVLLNDVQLLLTQAADEVAAHYFSRISEQQQTLTPVIR